METHSFLVYCKSLGHLGHLGWKASQILCWTYWSDFEKLIHWFRRRQSTRWAEGDLEMTTRRRRTQDQNLQKLRDGDAMLNAGTDEAFVLQTLDVSEATRDLWWKQFDGMKIAETKRATVSRSRLRISSQSIPKVAYHHGLSF